MASAGEDVFHIDEEEVDVDGGVSWGACGVLSRSSSVSMISTTLFRVRSDVSLNGGGLGSTR